MVPIPGTSRSGIHSTITTKLTIDQRLAEGDRQVPDEPGVEHVPGRQAEMAADHERDRDAVEHQADVELRQAPTEPAGPQLRDRAEVGEDPGRGSGRRCGHDLILTQSGL